MRNLKRVLSLTLASVMLLGMMVVGSSAAAGFPDVDENDNIEAIEVLQAVEVMVGDDRGFGPDRPVTRNEMAVVMGKLLNLDYNYYTSTCPFNDVANWARGWVGACYANGIVSGRGEGVYDGESTVTAVEAASMMMRALGYFRYQNDYADGFTVSTVRQGTKIGIFDMVGTDATTPMTRNQVAQMALNALQTGMVEPDGNTINLTTPDGSVFTGKVNYVNVTSWKDYAAAINDLQATSAGSTNTGYIVELGEQLYNGDLKLYDNRTDDFGRPSRKWEYDGKAIGTYMKKELIDQEWTNKVTGKDLYDLLGSDTIKNYDFEITIDGVNVAEKKSVIDTKAKAYFDATHMAKTWKETVGKTGKGVLTQVFVDPDYGKYGKVWVSVINTYLAKATNDYSEKKDEVSLEVYGLAVDGSGSNAVYYKYYDATNKLVACEKTDKQTEILKISGEDFSKAESMKKDDIVLVTEANGEIKTVSDPQILAAVELNEFSKNKYVVADQKYEYNTTIDYDPEVLEYYTNESTSAIQQLKDTEYNLFLDPYGYLIGVEVVEAVKNYIFLTGIDQGSSNLNAKVSDAAGILTDGTFINFRMNMKDSKTVVDSVSKKTVHPAGQTDSTATNKTMGKFQGHALWNTWCTYTVDKDGTYTLTEVGDFASTQGAKPAKAGQFADFASAGKKIDTKHVSLIGKDDNRDGTADKYVYGNDDSVYILAEVKEVTSKNTIYAEFPVAGNNQTVSDTNGTQDLAEEKPVVVISGVDSMGTGVDNVKIETLANAGEILSAASNPASTAKAYPGYIYTLFDRDGYVIAAVLLGEDSGTTKNLVYSHKSSVESEKYDKAEDEWTWTRYVIFNGEEILLTQKGNDEDIAGGIEHMDENVWYEVTYKADGTVKEAKLAFFDEDTTNVGHSTLTGATDKKSSDGGVMFASVDNTLNGDFVYDIENLEHALNDGKNDGTTLYEEVWGVHGQTIAGTETAVGAKNSQLKKANAPSLKGSTLYVDTDKNKGFYVHSDVKSVLIQTNNGETTTSYGSGTSDLESFLKSLNYVGADDTGTYLFKISAILTDGRATVVVIHDWNKGTATPGTVNPKDDEEETGDIDVYVSYRTNAGDATTQLSEETFKMSRASNGRLVLDKATATAKMGAAWKDYYTITDTAFPKTLTVAPDTSYAEVVVEVTRDTKTLTLPNDWKATWPVDADKYITTAGNFESDTAGETSVAIPTGAVVTITPLDGDCAATHYLYNPLVADDKKMGSGANGAAVATAWGTATIAIGDTTAVSLSATNKYSSITVATNIITNASLAKLGGITMGASVTSWGADAIKIGTTQYVKQGATITATFTATGDGPTTGTISAAVDAGVTGITPASPKQLLDNSQAGTDLIATPTVTGTVANTTLDITDLAYTLS